MQSSLPLKFPPKKICILRLSALGDVSHVLPVVRSLRSQWPHCEITWICGTFEYKLLKLVPDIKFILFNKKDGISAYRKLKQSLAGVHFDVLLHMQVAFRANIASLFVKADIKLGWDKNRSRDLHSLFINQSVSVSPLQHQVPGFLSFAESLGVKCEKLEWGLPVTDTAEAFVDKNIAPDNKVLVISPCSSHEFRNWNTQRYAAVADYAVDKYGVQVVLSGGPSELEVSVATEIQALMKHAVTNLIGKDTLEQLLGILKRADVVISPDSGPAHLANAVGTKVIGLYACTWSKRSGPYNSLNYCVDKFEQAAIKYKNKKPEDLKWGTRIEYPEVMDLITVEEVCRKIDQVFMQA